MSLTIGSRLGPYEILSRIGEGGMGQVWKARDTRLDRIVAIKTSAAKFSERFEREARAVAALNHPHICTLYDVGPDYLVMEYVEGPEIKGPLPLDQALKLAIQLASALEAAHRKTITHRDLKPANVLVTKAGVKVLDFGLAKFETAKPDPLSDETVTRALTQDGSIVGTLQYMAPEQLQAKTVDARADIFSFGCVLYEMITGQRAFAGTNTASVIAAILERPAPTLEGVAPASVDWLLGRCLAKDPDERWQTARDLRATLERVAVVAIEAQRTRLPPRVLTLAWGIAGAAMIAAGAVSFVHFREQPAEIPVTRLSVNPPEKGRFPGVNGSPPVVSPDGRKVVFSAISSDGKAQLWLRPLDSPAARPLAGTENAGLPFWSPDSRWIGLFAGSKLKKMDIGGGAATVLADAPDGRGGTWNQDGVIVFVPTPFGGLQQISASGGPVRPVIAADPKNPRRFPEFLPDGKHILYLSGTGVGAGERRIGIASLDSPSGDRMLTEAVDSFAIYAQGSLLFLRGSTLVARPFDSRSLSFTGDAVPLADDVQVGRSPNGLAKFSVSGNGVLVYRTGMSEVRLTWLDRAGKRFDTVGDPGTMGGVRFSPDHKTVALAAMEASGGNVDVWIYDVARGLRTRFTFDPAIDASPVWSPDGSTIVFRSSRTGPDDLFRKPADGSRNEELLYADKLNKVPTSFSPDGKYLAYSLQDPKTGNDIWILPDPLGAPGAAKPYPFVRTAFNELDPQFSPDGRWIAYYSNESGKNEVYVTPFPGPGGKRQVSTAGGTSVVWRPDGKELFYVSADSRMMAAEVDGKSSAFEVKKVDALFGPLGGLFGFDVSADGQRFLATLPPEGESGEPLTVVQNWTAALKK